MDIEESPLHAIAAFNRSFDTNNPSQVQDSLQKEAKDDVQSKQIAPIAPIAPVAPVAPVERVAVVAPVAPIAPTELVNEVVAINDSRSIPSPPYTSNESIENIQKDTSVDDHSLNNQQSATPQPIANPPSPRKRSIEEVADAEQEPSAKRIYLDEDKTILEPHKDVPATETSNEQVLQEQPTLPGSTNYTPDVEQRPEPQNTNSIPPEHDIASTQSTVDVVGDIQRQPTTLPEPLQIVEEQTSSIAPSSYSQYGLTYNASSLVNSLQRKALEPMQQMRLQSLPILDNLSTQILQTLGKGPYQDTLNIVTQPKSDEGQAYNTLRNLLFASKRIYTRDAFLSPETLKMTTPEQQLTIRKVNLATFFISIFGSNDVGFFHLNDSFLDVFIPEGGRLLKSQGGLFLELKTQAYISAVGQDDKTQQQIFLELFEDDMTAKLLSRKEGEKKLTPIESDYISRAYSRREHLRELPLDYGLLQEKYPWTEFLREMVLYISKNQETILAPAASKRHFRRIIRTSPGPLQASTSVLQNSSEGAGSLANPGQSISVYHIPDHREETSHAGIPQNLNDGDIQASSSTTGYQHLGAQTVAEDQSPGYQQDMSGVSGNSEHNSMINMDSKGSPSFGNPPSASTAHPTQTTPTHILYEQARLAATARASPHNRRAGLPSQRRPWSTEEEHALMAGLDRVKGPHWSQILAMFGAGGTISEALKDRNQVQLKDKARNLKLFFLKSGIEVPYYLQFVTGELKTRAPSQAARNEKRKKQEDMAKDDAAHINALNVLSGGGRSIQDSNMEDEGEDEDDYEEEWQDTTSKSLDVTMLQVEDNNSLVPLMPPPPLPVPPVQTQHNKESDEVVQEATTTNNVVDPDAMQIDSTASLDIPDPQVISPAVDPVPNTSTALPVDPIPTIEITAIENEKNDSNASTLPHITEQPDIPVDDSMPLFPESIDTDLDLTDGTTVNDVSQILASLTGELSAENIQTIQNALEQVTSDEDTLKQLQSVLTASATGQDEPQLSIEELLATLSHLDQQAQIEDEQAETEPPLPTDSEQVAEHIDPQVDPDIDVQMPTMPQESSENHDVHDETVPTNILPEHLENQTIMDTSVDLPIPPIVVPDEPPMAKSEQQTLSPIHKSPEPVVKPDGNSPQDKLPVIDDSIEQSILEHIANAVRSSSP